MQSVMQSVSMGDLKQNPAAAVRMTEAGPLVVMSRTTPAAVMVLPGEWNRIAAKLAYYERQAVADLAIHNDDWVTGDELAAALAKMGSI